MGLRGKLGPNRFVKGIRGGCVPDLGVQRQKTIGLRHVNGIRPNAFTHFFVFRVSVILCHLELGLQAYRGAIHLLRPLHFLMPSFF